jgi:hypothetical protein
MYENYQLIVKKYIYFDKKQKKNHEIHSWFLKIYLL